MYCNASFGLIVIVIRKVSDFSASWRLISIGNFVLDCQLYCFWLGSLREFKSNNKKNILIIILTDRIIEFVQNYITIVIRREVLDLVNASHIQWFASEILHV